MIIRPILRGRDIKRYGYDFADKYLIATFPSKNYNIDEFPAVKQFLLGFYPKLKQTGENLTEEEIAAVLNHAKTQGIPIKDSSLRKSRKKTTNRWFETQDSISYWEDFYKQKIVYPETTQGAYFALDEKEHFIDKTSFMLISEKPKYLQALLSSKLFEFSYKKIFSSIELGKSGYQYNKHALIELPLLYPNEKVMKEIEILINKKEINELDNFIYKLYGLNEQEIEFIEFQ